MMHSNSTGLGESDKLIHIFSLNHGATIFIRMEPVLLYMARQCVKQATCTACDSDDENYTVMDTDTGIEENTVLYDVRCECGETDAIAVTSDGIMTSYNVSLSDASWNETEGEE